MGNEIEFLKKKEFRYKENELDKINQHINDVGVTKLDDSTRNTKEHIAKYKQTSSDRNDYTIRSAYHDIIIIKHNIEYRLDQLSEVKARNNGYSFRARPLISLGKNFVIMEKQLKYAISRGTIKIKKDEI